MSDKKYRLIIDIDGVLADFNTDFIRVLEEVSGKKANWDDHAAPPVWNYMEQIGFSKEDTKAALDARFNAPDAWLRLKPMFEAREALHVLSGMYDAGHEIYFLTDRPGKLHPHLQTILWLEAMGFPNAQVIITNNKGPIAEALKPDFVIDDKPDNVFTMKLASPSSRVFMYKRSWNDYPEFLDRCAELGIEVVSSLRGFFEALIKEEQVNAIVV